MRSPSVSSSRVDALAVQLGAVRRVEVDDDVRLRFLHDLGMPARRVAVRDGEVAFARAADHEPAPGDRCALPPSVTVTTSGSGSGSGVAARRRLRPLAGRVDHGHGRAASASREPRRAAGAAATAATRYGAAREAPGSRPWPGRGREPPAGPGCPSSGCATRVAMPNSPTARSSSTANLTRGGVSRAYASRRACSVRYSCSSPIEGALVRDELLAVGAREVDRVLVRDVDAGDGHRAVLVHLLGQLARELDGLHVRPEGATENAFEEALDRALDASQDAHSRESDSRAKGSGAPLTETAARTAQSAQRPEGDRAGAAAPARASADERDLAGAEHADPLQPAAAGHRARTAAASAEHESEGDERRVAAQDDRREPGRRP